MLKSNIVHIPGLNGLRAMAAISVLWGHCFQDTFGDWGLVGWRIPFIADGVTLFFVISGFLITYLLLKEQEEVGDICIPQFYMRRVLRIWPIYFGYMLVCIGVLTWMGDSKDLLNGSLWYYLMFVANVPFAVSAGLWPIVHYWSIGVEEQFYLIWPWMVKVGRKRLLWVTATFGLIWLFIKFILLYKTGHSAFYRFVAATRFDCMMLGGIGAILYFHRNNFFFSLLNSKVVFIVAWTMLLLSGLYSNYIPAPIRPQVIAVLSLLVVMSQLCKKPIVNLEKRMLDFVGKLSYGIYVIHPLVIFLLSAGYRQLSIPLSDNVQVMLIYCFVTVVTISLAWVSYTFFERPFLKMKSHFSIIQSQNHMDR